MYLATDQSQEVLGHEFRAKEFPFPRIKPFVTGRIYYYSNALNPSQIYNTARKIREMAVYYIILGAY